jgi:hypothetical protein
MRLALRLKRILTGCAENKIRLWEKTAPHIIAAKIQTPNCATTPVPGVFMLAMPCFPVPFFWIATNVDSPDVPIYRFL